MLNTNDRPSPSSCTTLSRKEELVDSLRAGAIEFNFRKGNSSKLQEANRFDSVLLDCADQSLIGSVARKFIGGSNYCACRVQFQLTHVIQFWQHE